MTGVVEAGTVIGLISSVISIIEATKTVYDAANDAQGQPEVFRQVASRLPLVHEILHSARERAQTLDQSRQDALRPILSSCKAKAEILEKIF
jgi:N-terminal domain on NACHT_NTPase and P-loop NTPases